MSLLVYMFVVYNDDRDRLHGELEALENTRQELKSRLMRSEAVRRIQRHYREGKESIGNNNKKNNKWLIEVQEKGSSGQEKGSSSSSRKVYYNLPQMRRKEVLEVNDPNLVFLEAQIRSRVAYVELDGGRGSYEEANRVCRGYTTTDLTQEELRKHPMKGIQLSTAVELCSGEEILPI